MPPCCRACWWTRARATTAAGQTRRSPFSRAVRFRRHHLLGAAELRLGRRGRPRRPPARVEQTRQLQVQLMDRVAREIVEAHAQAESLRGQIAVAQLGVAWRASRTGGTSTASAAARACRSKCSSRSKRWTRAAASTCGRWATTTSGNSASTAPSCCPIPPEAGPTR